MGSQWGRLGSEGPMNEFPRRDDEALKFRWVAFYVKFSFEF